MSSLIVPSINISILSVIAVITSFKFVTVFNNLLLYIESTLSTFI